jgi:DNA primase large subunit
MPEESTITDPHMAGNTPEVVEDSLFSESDRKLMRGARTLAVSIELLKYPFSVEARSSVQKLARDIGSLIKILEEPQNYDIIDEAENRVYAALTNSEIKLPSLVREEALLVYQTARLIVEKIGRRTLREKQAVEESKAVNRHLGSEKERYVWSLCTDSLGWEIESTGTSSERARLPISLRSFDYRIRFEDFLEVAPSLKDATGKWKLINRHLDKGWVSIRKSELHRLISGKFENLIKQSEINIPDLPMRLTEAVQRIESEMPDYVREPTEIELPEDASTAFPPCIANLHQDSIDGKNVSHYGRFVLAAFLININMDEKSIMSIFEAAPDFARSLAGYQVDHIRRKEYVSPSCKKIQREGLCPVHLGTASDPLCRFVLHPLAFYKTRAWEMSKGITDHSWYARRMTPKQTF